MLIFIIVVLSSIFIYQIKSTQEIISSISDRPDLSSFLTELAESGLLDKPFDINDPTLKTRSIYITSYFNEYLSNNVISKLIYLDQVKKDTINLYISSNGGWGGPAMAIIETIKNLKSPVNTIALGPCYSSATLILVSGTGKRYAYDKSIIMVHTNVDSSSKEYSFDKIYTQWYESIFHENCQLPDSWFPMTDNKTYYLSAQEALKFKIIDRILTYKRPSNKIL
jgi:ATP-dependent Clp endopeptidase proteolytic subunit ClpP